MRRRSSGRCRFTTADAASSACEAAGLPPDADPRAAATHEGVARFVQGQSRAALDALAQARDIPLYTLNGGA